MKALQFGSAYLFATVAAIASFSIQAADSQPVEQYHYGQTLDVKRVIAIQEESPTSLNGGIVHARMDYLDSKGKLHRLAYYTLATRNNEGG